MRPRRWFCPWPFRFRPFLRRSEVDEELRGELHDHLERKTRELIICRLGGAACVGPRDCVAARLANPPADGAMALAEGQGHVRGEFLDRARVMR